PFPTRRSSDLLAHDISHDVRSRLDIVHEATRLTAVKRRVLQITHESWRRHHGRVPDDIERLSASRKASYYRALAWAVSGEGSTGFLPLCHRLVAQNRLRKIRSLYSGGMNASSVARNRVPTEMHCDPSAKPEPTPRP